MQTEEEKKQKKKEYAHRYRQEHIEEYKNRVNKYALTHKEQKKISMKKYHEKNWDKRKEWHLKKLGITLHEYKIMLGKQEGRCAICGEIEKEKHQSGNIKSLSVDHDHVTNKIRGLLCSACNTAIGKFKDDPLLLTKAINYLAQR